MDDKKLEKDIMVEGKVKKEGEDMPEKMNDKIEVKEKGNVPQEDAFKDKFKSLKTKAAENNKENKKKSRKRKHKADAAAAAPEQAADRPAGQDAENSDEAIRNYSL